MIKVSDLVFKYLESIGVKTVFTLTGGGIMHLVNSLGHSGMDYICCHHEQACSIAAQAHNMYSEELSVCLVTTGPGGTNALTGAAAAFVDSTPVIFISGQVKKSDFASLRGVRQFGAQENDIISMVKPVTKYAVLVDKKENILYEIQKSIFYATNGRKGPVWIDIPLDIQDEMVEENELCTFNMTEKPKRDLAYEVEHTIELLKNSRRPVILVGQGMISSKAAEETEKLVNNLPIPVLATWRALDFMDSESDIFFGSPGLQAPRFSNLIIQHCDLLIVLGSRLDNMITAFNEEHFAFRAKKIIVDIDENEINKLSMPNVFPVAADVNEFVTDLNSKLNEELLCCDYTKWIERCLAIKKRFPIQEEKQDRAENVNLYSVTQEISKHCDEKDTIVISSTSRCNTAGHIAFHHKKGQKTISSMGMGSMGFALPSAIGAYYANGKNRVVVIEGDGSLQLNIQELETIVSYHINTKIFIFNNNAYSAITTMQERNFNSFYVGSNNESGVFMPNLERIAYAYDIPYEKIDSNENIQEKIKKVMEIEGTVICDIIGSRFFDEIPKCISKEDEKTGKRISAYLENPYPFMGDSELDEVSMYLLTEE